MADNSREKVLFSSFIGLVFGVRSFVKSFRTRKKVALIENTPTCSVRSLAMGPVEIYGDILAFKKPIPSPFSRKKCVYWAWEIEEYKKSGKHSKWVTVRKGVASHPFFLKDDSGQVLINPEKAQIDIPKDFEFRSGFGQDPPENIISFLEQNNLSFEGFFGMNRKMRYREYLLKPGDKVYILGCAQDNPFQSEASAAQSSEDIMIAQGSPPHDFFYISDTAEKNVLRKLQRMGHLQFWGGIALISICLAYIFYYFGFLF